MKLANRLGRFKISEEFIDFILSGGPRQVEFKELVQIIQSNIIILEAGYDVDDRSYGYAGASELFREVPEGEDPPWYEMVFNQSASPDYGFHVREVIRGQS